MNTRPCRQEVEPGRVVTAIVARVEPELANDAARIRRRLEQGSVDPELFRHALASVPPNERDAWIDAVLGIGEVPDDGPDLPRECVAYLPCSVNAVLELVEVCGVTSKDVFVDVGAGIGRVLALVHLLTGAAAIGLEVQAQLVSAANALLRRNRLDHLSVVHGDAAHALTQLAQGTIFFFYCPFSGARLERAIDALSPIARTHRLHVASVDVPMPARSWLRRISADHAAVLVHRSEPIG